jgi:hypothetical protein
MRQLRFLYLKALAVALLACGLAAPQQTSSKNVPPRPAANAWMLTPTPYPTWTPDIPASVRAQRDGTWDKASFRQLPLTDVTTEGEAISTGPDIFVSGDEPEIPDVPNRAVLTATFTRYRSVLSASELSLYSELTFRIETVFEDRTGSGHPVANHDITLLLPGGTVTLRSGRVLSHNTAPRELFLEPSHKYLLVLTYHSDGDYYLCDEDWDISDGVVHANTYRAQYFAKTAPSSTINGLTVQELPVALDKRLYGRH